MPDADQDPITLRCELEHAIVSIAVRDFLWRLVPVNDSDHDPERLRRYYDYDDLGLVEKLATLGKSTTHASLFWSQESEGKFLGTKKVITKVMRVIELCPNLEDTAISQDHCWVGRMSHVKLVNVRLALESLKKLKQLAGVCEGLTKALLKSPVYQNLTHLDVVSHVDVKTLLENIAYWNKDTSFLAVIEVLLDPVKGLQALQIFVVVVVGSDWDVRPVELQPEEARFVMLNDYRANILHISWMAGVNGGMDYWEFAERISVARKRGYLVLRIVPAIFRVDRFNPEVELTAEGQLWWS